jgi:endonuclease/exonuclease/phosphatase family metal-dependent hydrolase
MRIFYLNINSFLGDSSIKKALAERGALNCIRECRNDRLNLIIANLLFEKIKTEKYDIVFLSEFDPESMAAHYFKEKMEDDYVYGLPNAGNSIGSTIYSVTVCFLKRKICDNRSDKYETNKNVENILTWCEIGGKKENILPYICGVHFGNYMNTWKKNREIIYKNNPFIVVGDFNANKMKEESNKPFVDVCDSFKAQEVVNKQEKPTYRGITMIDRVITNIKGIEVEADDYYYKNGLSDHAALIVKVPEVIEMTE